MTAARGYLVFLGDDTSPHGYVWLTQDRVKHGCTWKATAAGLARALYIVPSSTTITVHDNTRLCAAIKRRRDRIERLPGGIAESFADSYRAVLRARQDAYFRAFLRHCPAAMQKRSPGGVGLL